MLLSFWLLILPSLVFADKIAKYELYGLGGQTLYSCRNYIRKIVTFCDGGGYSCWCTDQNALATVAGCFGVQHRNKPGNYKYFITYCAERYNTTIDAATMEAAYEYYEANAVAIKDIPNFNRSVPVDVPILVNSSTVKLIEDAYVVYLGNYDNSLYYGGAAIGYWGLMAVIAIVANWGVVLFPGTRNFFNGTFSKFFRKYITLPALGKKNRSVSKRILWVDFLVPTRLESLVVFIFFWLLFAFCVVDIYYVPNNPVFPIKDVALTRFVADRTGIICTILTPLLVLFGGRNNFLQWLTRWNFTTMMVFHRWIARFVVILAFIHSVGYTYIYVVGGYYARQMAKKFLIWGTVATACGGLICFQGLLILRRKYYEVFLALHIALAVFFVVGLWFHVDTLGYAWFMYAVFAVWGFDRAIRLARLAVFGFPKAHVSLLADETLKVEVPKPKYWHSIAGGHAWIHFGLPFHFLQSHPFTFVDSVSKEHTIVFYCKVKSGVTKALYKKLVAVPGKTMTIRVGVEGPYGETSVVSKHSSAVYVAGGSGIPGIYSEVHNMARTNIQQLKLVWIIREIKSIGWFWEELQALKNSKVQTTIYITRPELTADELVEMLDLSSSNSENKVSDKDEKDEDLFARVEEEFPHFEIKAGRPDLKQLVQTEIADCANSVAFVTCGHPALVDDLHYNVVQQLDHTRKRVDFYEQLQIWA